MQPMANMRKSGAYFMVQQLSRIFRKQLVADDSFSLKLLRSAMFDNQHLAKT